MISFQTFNNVKYYSKVVIILLVVFLLLRFVLDIKPYESILLASIIAVSILIIENIIYINNNASDPLNCNQCKVSVIETDNPKINIDSGTKVEVEEQFVGNITDKLTELIDKVLPRSINDNNYEYKCYRVEKEGGKIINSEKSENSSSNDNNSYNNDNDNISNIYDNNLNNKIENFEQFINSQNKQNMEMKNNKQECTSTPESRPEFKPGFNPQSNPDSKPEFKPGFNPDSKPEFKPGFNPQSNPESNSECSPESRPEFKPGFNPESRPEFKPGFNPECSPESRPEFKPGFNPESRPESRPEFKPGFNPESKPVKVSTESNDISYNVDYTEYQQDGLQEKASEQSAKVNKFRREIGNQEVVTPWTKDGYKYYADIFTRSVGAPPANEALTDELKYGDYNYVGPLNKGMINKEYTFVSPTNWYPIPPHPPVCVTNKSCTTCPIQISDGKDYMQWASWEDFDKSRRFTGDMGINIDYVKNVLNNPDGF